MADVDLVRPVSADRMTGPLRTTELIRDRAVQAVLSQSGLNHPALAAEVRRRFGSTDVDVGALVREPLIEGAAPFVSSGRTFADCAGAPLHPAVIRAIASEQAGDYRFAGEAQPYRHQFEVWEHLTAPDRRSVLVSSGTGSGKTECFLMPLLSDLAGEAERTSKLSGVRALMLYPLNALIASQEERLRAWCAPFGDRVRFGLYNGMTPEKANRHSPPAPEQVRDRETLRRDPPPILVTNVTMLEYMTVRRVDRPLIENSRGALRWIILDEAHGYVGSAAAEIALLIRRVLLTFGVRAQDVRFVATSATIGDPLGGKDVTDELRRFLRDLSGADEDQVKVVLGARERVILPPPVAIPLLTAELLSNRDAVAANPAVQAFVRAAETRPMALAEVRAVLAPTGVPTEDAVGAVAADGDAQRGPLLPLRIHGFLRAVPGLWSCLNPDCGDAPAGWAFGAIAAERIDACPTCRSPVFEVKLCRECGEPYLECEERNGHLHTVTTPPEVDEFAVSAHEAPDDGEQDDDDAKPQEVYDAAKLAIASRALPGWPLVPIDPTTGRRPDQSEPGMCTMPIHLPDGCGACGASAKEGSILRAFRYGAPFLIGNAAPVLLEGLPPRPADAAAPYRPPVDGRQLLSFTDSRQGTARFAASLQTTAERSFVRGFVYHAVQGSMTAAAEDSPAVAALRAEIAQLEAIAAPTLAELIAGKKDALAKATTPSVDGLRWPELRRALAAAPEIHHWMTKVWAPRDERFSKSAEAFAEFLLLREFNRRPRRGNTAETMGLARLRFDAIDHATKVPEPLVARGFGVADWQGLLSSMLDMTVRGRFAIRASWDDLHWLHTQKPITTLLAPGEQVQSSHESAWPMAGAKPGTPSNLVLILEKTLGLDRSDAQDRTRINAVLEAAWQRLMPLLSSRTEPGYALDFDDARIAPVTQAWLCPVSGRVLPATALGRTQYGHRERLRTADVSPQLLVFPRLPVTFPRSSETETIRRWLDDDQVQALRDQGVWSNLHDRVALLSPYLRAAEHSAQQPPARLRGFEAAFKRGEINILNCSTTMEMGVDIGSVSAVMMTNVPPALANYRQRVGRAGRRRQGFASSLTYTRSTPLDREAFHDPLIYLARQTRVPQVRLDSRRIVQRHVNALLLARWFASAGGEAMKTRVGDFFGCPPVLGTQVDPGAPINMCFAWLDAPSTHDAMGSELAALTRGTALAGDRTTFVATTRALTAAQDAVVREWQALQQQAEGAPPEGRKSVEYQLKRLALDNLLKELAQRGVLPGHGFPTGVVPFVNADSPAADERAADDDDSSRRRRSFPTRTLDIAIRDYAPGAEVVVDGLVYRSAGVTLNWQRPADDVAAREVQNIKLFWTCTACGAADTAHSAPEHCPTCHADVPPDAQRRFLEPAGFTADMRAKPHADTDEVTYVEPERERIVARGAAWAPMVDPTQGRMRASNEGLVFYSSRGPSKQGYHVCLECGRAEPAGQSDAPLAGHQPLRFTKKDGSGLCPGNGKPFKITRAIALGYESVTDVIEVQPVDLESEGVAWAVTSALREALVRRLGVEPGELGMAVRAATTPLGQRTHSLFLYDRASGGAGFAPQAAGMYDALLADAETILDCRQPGCTRGCSACVLTADLHKQQETIDRIGALGWIKAARAALASVAEVDRAAPDAQLARAVSDEIAAAVERGVRAVTIWPSADSDVAALGEGSFPTLVRHIGDLGARVTLVVDPVWLASLDPAARLALRDAAVSLALDLREGTAPVFANGARMLAATAGGAATLWASRDGTAATLGIGWGQGASAPVVRIAAGKPVLATVVGLDTLLPVSGTRFLELRAEVDGTIAGFGERLLARLLPAIRAAGGNTRLERIAYADRYLQSPLVLRLMTEALAALRDQLAAPDAALPLAIVTNAFRPNDRQPYAPDHDWQWEDDRREVLLALLEARGFSVDLAERGAAHGRTITLAFAGGTTVRVVLDQGFGPWRTPRYAKFDFGDAVDRQVTKIAAYSAMIEARGASYVVVTG